ncbi:hypothetical protein G3M48_004641 [Beauveria asiatica]|uniref:Uncharacterized protein n=1 Tax=Beauveria asiatica TaxID=1069075 RepID=A0AAW0RSS2_9HYPO
MSTTLSPAPSFTTGLPASCPDSHWLQPPPRGEPGALFFASAPVTNSVHGLHNPVSTLWQCGQLSSHAILHLQAFASQPVRHRHIHKGEDQCTCSRDGCLDKFCCTVATAEYQHLSPQRDLSANSMDKTPRDPTQAAMSGPVSAVAPGLSTPQSDGFFPDFDQHTYQLGMQDVLSYDAQQYAMNQQSHFIQRASSAAEHGEPGATAISTESSISRTSIN